MSAISSLQRRATSPDRERGFQGPGLGLKGHGIDALAVAASVVVSLLVATALQLSLPAAFGLVVMIGVGAVVACSGLFGMTCVLAGVLPWAVVLTDVIPKLTETFTAGTTMVALLLVAAPRADGSRASTRLRLGMILFFTPVVIGLARDPGGPQFIQATKYLVFPFTVLAVTEGTNHLALARLKMVALASGAAAISVNLLMGSAGLNHSYYHAGDIQGLGSQHDIALLAGAVTAASLGMRAVGKWAPVSAVGAIATIATGVRSTLPGLLLVALVRMFQAGARVRTLIVIGAVGVAIFASGASNIVLNRFAQDEESGQFSSFGNLGSGRGTIYVTAVDAWWASSPVNWVVGTGLRSIPAFEDQRLGQGDVGHSDVIEVGVQIGLMGLAGLVLIWWALIARARSKLPLLVLVPFALFNGALEYGAPLVVTLLLTASSEDGDRRAEKRLIRRGPPQTNAEPGLVTSPSAALQDAQGS